MARIFYTVRRAQAGDARKMRAIEKECFGAGAWTLLEFKDALRKNVIWVAEYGPNMVGFVVTWMEPDPLRRGKKIPHVGSVDTTVKHRGKGVATMLLDQVHAHYHRAGFPRCSLQVAADNPAQCLYFRLGYRVVEFYPRRRTALGKGGALWMERS